MAAESFRYGPTTGPETEVIVVEELAEWQSLKALVLDSVCSPLRAGCTRWRWMSPSTGTSRRPRPAFTKRQSALGWRTVGVPETNRFGTASSLRGRRFTGLIWINGRKGAMSAGRPLAIEPLACRPPHPPHNDLAWSQRYRVHRLVLLRNASTLSSSDRKNSRTEAPLNLQVSLMLSRTRYS